MTTISIILPCRNEARSLGRLIPAIQSQCPGAEIIVVDDGSDDDSAAIAAAAGARVLSHPYRLGNGAAIKNGARAASGEFFIFMDADGQHDPKYIPALLELVQKDNYVMAVGARNSTSQASTARWAANSFYNRLSSWMVGHDILDLTSGFRAVRADKFKEFLYLLPNGFSYPTTITMAFFRAGYAVAYLPMIVHKREEESKSHIRPVRDGLRFLLIIFKIGTLYAPLKLFGPLSLLSFAGGLGNYLYTYTTIGRFTNMSALLFSTAVLIFLIGLVSEQITQLMYMREKEE
jgi:glycosyltransferase involved in cell wall biosynthesis